MSSSAHVEAFEFGDDTFYCSVARIVAMVDIPRHGVKKGDVGGWVSHETILSHAGSCWIGGDSIVASAGKMLTVSGDALIDRDARIFTKTATSLKISESAHITDSARVIQAVGEGQISGSAFVGRNALLESIAVITGMVTSNACIGENSSVLGEASVYGNAEVGANCTISGNAEVFGDVILGNWVKVSEKAKVQGNAILKEGVEVSDRAVVSDNAIVGQYATISHTAVVCGDARLMESCRVTHSAIVEGDAVVNPYGVVQGRSHLSGNAEVVSFATMEEDADHGTGLESIKSTMSKEYPVEVVSPFLREKSPMEKKFEDLKARIESYETDIVKIIKYPAITDLSDEKTLDMVLALNEADSLNPITEPAEFAVAVKALERAFLIAESNARKLAGTVFNEAQAKKASKATDLLAIVTNESSADQEKRAAFKQVFKQLEGVVAVPDAAVDVLRIRSGISEIEA